jgi:murein hydrolase activator
VLAGLAVAIAAPPGPGAQAQAPKTTNDAKKKLESQKKVLDSVKKRTKTLQGDVEALAAERKRLNAKLVDTAALIKKSEGKLTTTETRLGELEAQEKILRGSLNQRHGQISKLLSALQRMGRNPPPVLMTQREDALKMVRSAMLLAAAFPELGEQARSLAARLQELVRVMSEIRTQGEQLRSEMTRLTDARTRLSGLLEEKKVSLEQRQSELASMRSAAAEISTSVTDLNELISRLDKAVHDNTGLGAYDAATRKAASAEASITKRSGKDGQEIAALPIPPKAPGVVELPPGTTLGSPGRIKPEIAFAKAQGRLPLPAHGRRVLAYSEKTQYGGQSKGIVLETRQGAQITSPCDGWIVYAGEFRSYGQLLIINAGGGYHVLLAGLSQIDVQPGQFVLAAEPVGTMSGWLKQAQPVAAGGAPVLYVEFRKDGKPIDPDPWWVKGHQKVQG